MMTDLRVEERRGESACSQLSEVGDAPVYEADDCLHEDARIQENTSATSGAIGTTPSVRRSSLLLKSSKKLAHGVS